MIPAEDERAERRRAELERHAAVLFGVAALAMAIVCGAVIASGWFAGVIEDHWERLFWVGAVLAGVMVAVFAMAALPGGPDARRACVRITALLRVGLALFVLAPALCILALVGDFFWSR
jgi:MFS family permease